MSWKPLVLLDSNAKLQPIMPAFSSAEDVYLAAAASLSRDPDLLNMQKKTEQSLY